MSLSTSNGSQPNINSHIDEIDDFFRLAVSVDCVIFGYDGADLKVLVQKCNMPPYEGRWSLIGDLLNPEEDLEAAAERILKEKTGVEGLYLEQLRAFGKAGRHPLGRVVTVAYYALVKIDDLHPNFDLGNELHWHNIYDNCPLAFDHDLILQTSINRLRQRIWQEQIWCNLLPPKFTLSQLQQLFEVILGEELDKRNFRKKITRQDFIKDEKELQREVAHRPAKLYSVKS